MDAVAEVRAFNRFYTRHVGALGRGLLATPWSLTEARLLYELAQAPATEVADLRRATGMDAGQLSRVLARLEGHGLVTRESSRADGRRQVTRLTAAGRAAFAELDRHASDEVAARLERLGAGERRQLVAAMHTLRRALAEAPEPAAVLLRTAEPGDLGWIVGRNGALYAEEQQWDESYEALVLRIVAAYAERRDVRREAAWIAEVDGRRAGCVMCVRKDERTAQLRLLLVEPWARRLGVGGGLVDTCLRFARRAGYDEMVLWTNDVLDAARRLYERAGFTLVAEAPHHSFGRDLVGQTWSRPLRTGPRPPRTSSAPLHDDDDGEADSIATPLGGR